MAFTIIPQLTLYLAVIQYEILKLLHNVGDNGEQQSRLNSIYQTLFQFTFFLRIR